MPRMANKNTAKSDCWGSTTPWSLDAGRIMPTVSKKPCGHLVSRDALLACEDWKVCGVAVRMRLGETRWEPLKDLSPAYLIGCESTEAHNVRLLALGYVHASQLCCARSSSKTDPLIMSSYYCHLRLYSPAMSVEMASLFRPGNCSIR